MPLPPEPPRPRRRINPDKPPLDRLPLIRADSHGGPIQVIRGEFDLDELTDAQRDDVLLMHGNDFVVFTNSLGQHRLAWRNQLVGRNLDLAKVGNLPTEYSPKNGDPDGWLPSSIEAGAATLRFQAESLLALAEKYGQLAAEGWDTPDTRAALPRSRAAVRARRRPVHPGRAAHQEGPATGSERGRLTGRHTRSVGASS